MRSYDLIPHELSLNFLTVCAGYQIDGVSNRLPKK